MGRDPVSAVRLPAELTASVDKWSEDHETNRSEVIRRLVELGLTIRTKAKQPSPMRAARAKELATKAIEKIIDRQAAPEEQAQRTRRLTKGPLEFRELRVDLPNAKE
jgi:Arc/MetJ-type ribon-helix-helix transcriptional regulator